MVQKLTVLFLVLFGAFYKISADDSVAYTLEEENHPPHLNEDGSQTYDFRFKTSNGIERQESGSENANDEIGLTVQGRYAYVHPDGTRRVVAYEADKDGFRIVPNLKVVLSSVLGFKTK